MQLDDFDYKLPPDLIAQDPLPVRSASRLLVMRRETGACELRSFSEFPSFIRAGDCLVVNDTQVIPARLFGRRVTGGRVEILLMHALADIPGQWQALIRPGKRQPTGSQIILDHPADCTVTVTQKLPNGTVHLAFDTTDVLELAGRVGKIPLPPYIEREADAADAARYQTVYARHPGAVAAPTAGLHFTPAILDQVQAAGATVAHVTLHVGPGTFLPVKSAHIEDHVMHAEHYHITPEAAAVVNRTRTTGGRVFAVGTTSVRVIETATDSATGMVAEGEGWTTLFLHPPLRPRVTDALLTNFHLPKSTLLMLVSAFSSVDHVKAAYALAIRERFRFFSYGDCMLLL